MMLAHGMPGVWNSWFRRSQDSDSRVDAVSQLAGPRLRGVIMVRVSLPQESLSKVDFGAPAAERDIERGLDEYFVESEAYSRVKAGAKRILIGGRGAVPGLHLD